MEHPEIPENYSRVIDRISNAETLSGRSSGSVKLIVVTKGHPVSAIRQVYKSGARLIGENYVEEAVEKMQAVPDLPDLIWDMIGHVQSRKARLVCEYFHWLHSLDSLKLAERLDRFAGEFGTILNVLLECNVSGEESKSGWQAWNEDRWRDLLAEFNLIALMPNLRVKGLMTMPPFSDNPEDSRSNFRRLRCLRDWLIEQIPAAGWEQLSMGMSADFEVAIQEGATLVRIGTAIMGPRPS